MTKDIKSTEWLDKPTDEETLQEAPASASVKVKSTSGFEWLFTIRDLHASKLMYKINAMEQKWLELGWTPLSQQSGFKSNPVTPQTPSNLGVCANCGAPNLLSQKGKKYCSKRCWL